MERSYLIAEVVAMKRIFVPYENFLENCISEWNGLGFDARNLFDNDWHINGKKNSGMHVLLKSGQAWAAVDLGKTYILKMAYFQGREYKYFDRLKGVKFHVCSEFQRPKSIGDITYDINQSACPLCGEMKDIIYRQSGHIDFIPCITPLQGRYLIVHISSWTGVTAVVENIGAVAVEMNIFH